MSLGLFKQANPQILEGLKKNSELLYRIQADFHTMLRDRKKRNDPDIEIVCFFEELPIIGFGFVVPKESAALSTYQSTGLHYNHSEMTRFKDAQDPAFIAISAELLRWSKPIYQVVKPRAANGPRSEAKSLSRIGFRRIAQILDLPGNEDAESDMVLTVSLYLQRGNCEPWLLVLDNADDARLLTEGDTALARFVSKYRGGYVIISTRDRYVAQVLMGKADALTVTTLSPEDAKKLFRSRLPDDMDFDEDIERQILENLEHLPLCITQAAAYIDCTKISLHEYLRELTESERSLLEVLDGDHVDLRRDYDSPNSVLRAWKISFEKIRGNYAQAGQLLSVMAFLDRQYISRDLLQGLVESRHQLNAALGILQGFCLVVAESSNDSFKMHRLVQLATGFWLLSKKTDYETLALKLVTAKFDQTGHDNQTMWRLLIPHAKVIETYEFQDKDSNLLLAKLQYNIASHDLHAGHYDIAAKSCQESYSKQVGLGGESNLDTLKTAGLLGVIRKHQGLYDEANVLQQRVLSKKEETLGSEHLDTVNTWMDLSEVLERQGEFVTSQELAEKALKVRKRRLGNDNIKTLQTLMHLALLLRRQARYRDAEALGREVLQGYQRILPWPHEITLKSGYALAGTLRENGKFDEEVAEGRKRILGDEHPQTLLAINNLALGYRLKGELRKAEEHYRNICAAHDKCQRQNHPEAIQVCQNLAVVLRDQKKYKEAEKIGRDTLERRERVLGPEHLSTVNTALDLAMTLEQEKKYAEASSLALRVLAVRTKRLGEAHTYTLDTLFTIASINERLGDVDIAKEKFQVVLDGRMKTLGKNHPATRETADRLASLGITVPEDTWAIGEEM
ncbi:hypothetical protein MMC17_009632 [Xylographa soralifera]|nr:hypothetical protein [Xylographa soralifera]